MRRSFDALRLLRMTDAFVIDRFCRGPYAQWLQLPGGGKPPLHNRESIETLIFPLVKRGQRVYTGCNIYQIFAGGLL